VIADERTRGRTISLGAGERGVAIAVAADDAVRALGASFADVTEAVPS
jgi:prolyl-tRNA editing enzyme YbaK/EbsC (Cys-tRNA(Pro) deacylase)